MATAPAGGFAYRALRADGSVARGRLDAASRVDAVATLERRGMLVLEVDQVRSARDRRHEIPTADLALGLRLLGDVLDAGLPVARALNVLGEVAPKSWSNVVPHLRDSIREGKSLGAALRDSPAEVPALVVGMVAAGEIAGNVSVAVRRAAEVTEAMAETKSAIRNALAYPALLAVAGTGAIGLMVGVVIPRFAVILGDLSQSLPASTRFVLDAAEVIRGAAIPGAIVLVLGAITLRAWTSTRNGQRQLHDTLLQAPVVGALRRATATTRASLTLATLLETGVPLRQSLIFAAQASGDAAVEARLRRSAQRVESGASIAAAIRETAAFTPLALRLVQAGEESGRLAPMLRHAARIEQDRSERAMKTAVRLLEPVLILLFAGVVALVAAALLQAVYAVRPTA
jgi:type II secretory pathway component PulF